MRACDAAAIDRLGSRAIGSYVYVKCYDASGQLTLMTLMTRMTLLMRFPIKHVHSHTFARQVLTALGCAPGNPVDLHPFSISGFPGGSKNMMMQASNVVTVPFSPQVPTATEPGVACPRRERAVADAQVFSRRLLLLLPTLLLLSRHRKGLRQATATRRSQLRFRRLLCRTWRPRVGVRTRVSRKMTQAHSTSR